MEVGLEECSFEGGEGWVLEVDFFFADAARVALVSIIVFTMIAITI